MLPRKDSPLLRVALFGLLVNPALPVCLVPVVSVVFRLRLNALLMLRRRADLDFWVCSVVKVTTTNGEFNSALADDAYDDSYT